MPFLECDIVIFTPLPIVDVTRFQFFIFIDSPQTLLYEYNRLVKTLLLHFTLW